MTIRFYQLGSLTPSERAELLRRSETDLNQFKEEVRPIIERVRLEGDQALVFYAGVFEKAALTPATLKVSQAEFEHGYSALSKEVDEALSYAIENITAFHRAQLPPEMWFKELRDGGGWVGERVSAIPSVACYVPRGKGSFPSVAMMTTIAAKIARVPRIAVFTPCDPDGAVDSATLVACHRVGVTEIYKVGGAAAVATAAFGTQSIEPLTKIEGPGGPWFMAAKRLLAESSLDMGLSAGPSEALILADESSQGELAALDLLIESEHGVDSSAFLVTESRAVATAALKAIPSYWDLLGVERAAYSKAVLGGKRGGVLLADSLDQAVDFVNDYAPEHLLIHSAHPFDHLDKIKHAAEILLGADTPLTLANYLLGPNCVLPTSGQARTWSPLSVHSFLKRTSIASVSRRGYPTLARHARVLASYEGFDAHALAVSEFRQTVKDNDTAS